MNEHDSLVSHALNNMTVSDLISEYAKLKIENDKLKVSLNRALRISAMVSEHFYEPPQQIASFKELEP